MYEHPPLNEPLTQGDNLDECPVISIDANAPEGHFFSTQGSRERVIVLTQACDVENDRISRIQIAVIHEANKLVEHGILKPGKIRDNVRRHQVYG